MKTKFSLQNQTVIITGGGSGIGKAIAKTFGTQGADVHILDINIDMANKVSAEISSRAKQSAMDLPERDLAELIIQ